MRFPWLAEGPVSIVLLGLGNGFEDNSTCTGGAEVGHFLQLLPLQSRLGMPCLPFGVPAALASGLPFGLPPGLRRLPALLPFAVCLPGAACLLFFLSVVSWARHSLKSVARHTFQPVCGIVF